MAAFENFRGWLSEKLNPAQPTIAASQAISTAEIIADYQTAYREIEVVHRAVDIIINAMEAVPFRVEGPSPQKKINKLLNKRPNPFEDRARFFRRAFLDFMLDGNAFFYYDGKWLYLLPANNVDIIPSPTTFVESYEYSMSTNANSSVFGSTSKKGRKSISFAPSEIIHVCSENDQDIFRGASRLKSLERLIELYYNLISFQRQFFKNNAIPGTVLTTDAVLSPKIKDRLLTAWREAHGSMFNGARSPAILDGGLKVDTIGTTNFSEMDFENSVDRVQQDIAKALGVPYVLLKSGNNANISQNQVLFYEHTIIPMLRQFSEAFHHFFAVDEMIIEPDEKIIKALQPDLRTQSQFYSTLVNTGIITANEARRGLNFKSLDDDECNTIRIPQNITGSATDASQGGRPDEESRPVVSEDVLQAEDN